MRTNYHHTEETKKKISEAHKIYQSNRPQEHNDNIGKGQLGIKRKPHSEITKKKISLAQIGYKNHNWKGGFSTTHEYKKWHSRLMSHKRRLLIKQTNSSFTKKEWENLKEKYGYKCPNCKRKEPDILLTIDHITPINLGGLSYISNIQPLCGKCNSSKNAKTIKYQQQLNMVLKK